MPRTGQGLYLPLCDRALAWVQAHRDDFALPQLEDQFPSSMLKPLIDLAITADVLSSFRTKRSQAEAAKQLADFCWAEVDEGKTLARLVAEDPTTVFVAPMYVALRRHGYRHVQLERAFGHATSMGGVARLEFLPSVRLGLAAAFESLGIEAPWSTREARAWLAGRVQPWLVDEKSAYALTHAVFFQTNFGRSPTNLPDDDRSYLAMCLPAWIQQHLNFRNFDLMAEMIMVARCIGEDDADSWSARLAEVQEPDGMVPCPRGRTRLLDPTNHEAARRRFLDNYHTTLVVLMASAMSSDSSRGRQDGTSSRLPYGSSMA